MSSASDDDHQPDRSTRESVQMMTTADEYGGRKNTMPPPERPSVARDEQLLHPGDVVADRYRIDRELGRGGMGIVYAATQLSTGRPVALKWLFESAANRGERRKRFLREARAASAIEHASVVRVFDAGEHARGVFLAMELLEGESLRVYLQRTSLSVPAAVDLLMPALRGIAAAHAQGVIHRDLKPDNLWVLQGRDGVPQLKVLDFGLSKLIDRDDSLHTMPGAMLGTPQYMAPEQIEGSGHVDARCDLYSMAAILYEAVAGRRPFEALTLADLLAKLARDEPPALRQVARAFGKDVPPGFSQVVMRALHRDPAQRQATVEDFALAIEPFGTLEFHSTVAARDAYAQTLRTRRQAEPITKSLGLAGRRAMLAWLALATIAVGWLLLRMLAHQPDAAIPADLPIAKPAAALAPAAPPVPAPAPAHAAPPTPPVAPASTAAVEEPAPVPSEQDATEKPAHPASRAPSRARGHRPAEDPPGKALPRTDILDPWE